MKIAVNRRGGGFSLSKDVYTELGIEWDGFGYLDNKDFGLDSDNPFEFRNHPKLIAAIEKIGVKQSSGRHADLRIVDIPEGVDWEIGEYDGLETAREKSRSW